MAKAQIKMGISTTDYHQVRMDGSAMVSPHATLVGDVHLGAESSVFAGTHVRGDCAPIRIGARTNIQENCSLHVSVGSPLAIGNGVTVGHGATVHGCTIRDSVLVGMGSTVMDDAVIGEQCIIGAGALVTQRKEFPPRTLILGSPARAVRELSDQEIEEAVLLAADAYVDVARAMCAEGILVHPPADCSIWT